MADSRLEAKRITFTGKVEAVPSPLKLHEGFRRNVGKMMR
jgi:hypothetical protein